MSTTITTTLNRRRNPKVRTGCFTCKIRRVKCDEGKPSCSRCTSTGRKCDGYAKARMTLQDQAPSHHTVATPQYAISSLSGLGESFRYLEFYHHCAVPMLSNRFDRDFWSKTPLQMAYSEPAVRHAVIALGYLNKMESGSLKHARSEFQVVHGSKILLFHYNKAVRCLVDRMAEASYQPEIGLVTCLLFVCIEYLRANYHTAFTHLTNGLRVISDWQQQRRVDTPFEDSSPSTGSNDLIEDTILPMFLRGMTSAQLYGVKTEDHIEMPFPDPHSFIRDPFTLQEAERSSRELRNASVLLLRQIGFKIGYNMAVETEYLQRQAQILACHREWFQKVKSVEDSQHWPTDDRISLSALKVALYATQTYVACCASAQQLPSDEHLDTFKTLIHEAEIVLDAMDISNTHAARFTFEMSIIPPLYHTAARCRCPVTRRKAVSLLSRGPPREGLWDAEQYVLVLKRVIEFEESELDPETGWPVERTRLASCVIDANMDVKGGFWIYLTPSEWMGQVDANGKPRQLQERLQL